MNNLDKYKLFTQQIGIIGIANILIAVSSFFLLPILTKNLTVQNYGIWVQLSVTIELLPNLVLLGLPFTMVRFLAGVKENSIIKETFYSITFFVFFICVTISLLLFAFAKPISEFIFDGNIEIAMLMPLLVISSSFVLLFLNYFRTFQMMKIYSIISCLQAYITLLLIFTLFIFSKSLILAVLGLLVTKIIIMLIMFGIIVKEIGFKFPKFENMKEYLSFGLPTVPSAFSFWAINSSDRYLIGFFLGISFVAYYSPSYVLGNILMMLVTPFSLLLPAVLSKEYDNKNINAVEKTFRYSSKYFLAIGIPTVFFLSIFSKNILLALTTNEIALNGYFVTPFVAIGVLLYGMYLIINNILILEKKTKILGVIWIFAALLNVILNIILIPFLGIIGGAVTTLIAFATALILTTYYSSQFFTFKVETKFVTKSIIASAITSLIYFINPKGIVPLIIVILSGYLFYFLILLVLKGFSRKEIDFFKSFVKN